MIVCRNTQKRLGRGCHPYPRHQTTSTYRRIGINGGSVVLAASQLLQGLAQSNALSTAERREADLLLRTAASHPQNCRPLYRQIGTGKDSDPVSVLHMGDLGEELANLAMRNRF